MRAIRQLTGETRDAVYSSQTNVLAQLARQSDTLSSLEARLNDHSEALTGHTAALADLTAHAAMRDGKHEQLVEILRFVLARGPEAQQRLRRLREAPEYELSFSENEPLVSVVIPTYDNYELLRTRALPSVLAQSYQNFEVVVVGDAAPEEARDVVDGFGDPRISFFNLPYRGPYPIDRDALWFVVGTPPFNEATYRATGRWIAPLDDDDAFRTTHLERLLERARADRVELAYGQMDVQLPDGQTLRAGSFPPRYGQINLQAAIWHAGLSDIFQCHLADAPLRMANDWALVLRMMEAGVRIGFLEEVLVDYYPAKDYWGSASYSET